MSNQQELLEVLYDKTHECPICYKTFTSKAIRSGRNQVVSTDSDLYSKFSVVNPVLYDVILCDCGYAAISNTFDQVRPTQVEWVRKNVTSKYEGSPYPEILNESQAINKYKLAFFNATTKKARGGELGYICLKIGWLYRDLEDKENERTYLKHARNYLLEAFSSERFPIFELDELTTMFLVAELSRKIGDFDTALQWASNLITQSSVPDRLKQRALDLRDEVKKQTL